MGSLGREIRKEKSLVLSDLKAQIDQFMTYYSILDSAENVMTSLLGSLIEESIKQGDTKMLLWAEQQAFAYEFSDISDLIGAYEKRLSYLFEVGNYVALKDLNTEYLALDAEVDGDYVYDLFVQKIENLLFVVDRSGDQKRQAVELLRDFEKFNEGLFGAYWGVKMFSEGYHSRYELVFERAARKDLNLMKTRIEKLGSDVTQESLQYFAEIARVEREVDLVIWAQDLARNLGYIATGSSLTSEFEARNAVEAREVEEVPLMVAIAEMRNELEIRGLEGEEALEYLVIILRRLEQKNFPSSSVNYRLLATYELFYEVTQELELLSLAVPPAEALFTYNRIDANWERLRMLYLEKLERELNRVEMLRA